jgi:hypothetical protein
MISFAPGWAGRYRVWIVASWTEILQTEHEANISRGLEAEVAGIFPRAYRALCPTINRGVS